MPRLNGWLITIAPCARAWRGVVSVEPSSTTRMSKSGAWRRMSRTTRPTIPASLYAGTIASLRSSWVPFGVMRRSGGPQPPASHITERSLVLGLGLRLRQRGCLRGGVAAQQPPGGEVLGVAAADLRARAQQIVRGEIRARLGVGPHQVLLHR